MHSASTQGKYSRLFSLLWVAEIEPAVVSLQPDMANSWMVAIAAAAAALKRVSDAYDLLSCMLAGRIQLSEVPQAAFVGEASRVVAPKSFSSGSLTDSQSRRCRQGAHCPRSDAILPVRRSA